MKLFFYLATIFFSLALTAFSQVTVTVNGGYGGGNYRGSRPIHVWAEANPPNMVFDKWTGDTDLLFSANDWHTRVSPKKKNITLTAVYKPAPAWTPTFGTINNRQFGYYFPPNLRGLVFRFHGSGGSGTTFFTKIEDRIAANDFVAAGFAVVALDSDDRVNKQWSTALPPNNPDIINVQALIDSFIALGFITPNTPIFSSGMSNGGAFSPRVAYILQFKAAAIYCAAGSSFVNITNVPTIWGMAQNDGNDGVGAAGNATALANSQTLRNRGIASQFNMNIASPVYLQRFARIPGLTLSDSQIIYNSLKNNGFLDRDNYQTQNPSTSGWQNFVPVVYAPFGDEIFDQLQAAYAEHKFYSDFNSRVVAFFNAQI